MAKRETYTVEIAGLTRQFPLFEVASGVRIAIFNMLGDTYVVKAAAADEKTKGGIIIPDTAKEKPQRGSVVAVGPGKDDIKMTVRAGDTVLYGKYAGQELNYEGEDYLIMREDDILVIIG